MPRLTLSEFNESILAKRGYALAPQHIGPRPCPIIQKLQDDPLAAKANHDKAGTSALDGGSRPKFRVAITLRISDERDRDNDGAASTLFDCLIASIGRLTKVDSRTLRKYAASIQRKRRRKSLD